MEKNRLFIILMLTVFGCSSQSEQTVDLLLSNGQVYQNGEFSSVDIAVAADTIVAIGENLQAAYSADNIIDANNAFVMPGFIDAHAHLQGVGRSVNHLDFLQDTSWQQLVNKVKAKVAEVEDGEWIIGRGWHQEKWTDTPTQVVEGFPVHNELSAISPNNPVLLNHASGHGILVNAKAMELAGVTAQTKTPEGGYIVKDKSGEPIGVFQENAASLITNVYGQSQESLSEEEIVNRKKKVISLGIKQFAKNGITSVHDAGVSMKDVLLFQELAKNNELTIRLYTMLSQGGLLNASNDEIITLTEFKNPYFTCRSVKAYADGALGSRGAWLLQDYSDQAGYRGENVTPLSVLRKTAQICKEHDLQLAIHAIGDRANREVLNIYEDVMGEQLVDARWRIEHAQHLHPQEIERLGNIHVIASMQTVHCTSDAPYVIKRLGEQRAEEGAYVWQSLLENDVHIANGTDAPVERVNPFENMYSAVTRKSVNGEAFYPEQKLSRQQAIDSYTIWNAYAAFQEDVKGSIEVGKWADFTIVDRNLLTCDEEEIPTTKVLYTIVSGEVVYE